RDLKLQGLNVLGNLLEEIPSGRYLQDLAFFDASANRLTTVAALAQAHDLVQLLLAHNRIVDVSPFAKLIHLDELDLRKNQVQSVSSLKDLQSVGPARLRLSGNPILDKTCPLKAKAYEVSPGTFIMKSPCDFGITF
ncbi:MAG: hypothetical protein M3Q07_11190, partial [Pseudobdellovibrionaceae bacterium]|nr:hypothetical protein [Pseudobdellovibrionaceae bacterium]